MTKHHENLKELYALFERIGAAPARFSAMSEAARLHRIAERRCNGIPRWDAQARQMLGSWTDEDEAKAEREDNRAERRAIEAFASVLAPDDRARIRVAFQGDPRGAMICIYAASDVDGCGNRLAAW